MTLLDQIAAAHAAEVNEPDPPRTRDRLPVSYDAVTCDWLTSVVVPPDRRGIRVASFELGEPDNGTYNRRRIKLRYNRPAQDLPGTVFCKATHDLPNRLIMGVSGSARAEVTFYNEIRPLLDIEAPHSVFARFDPDSFNSMIMLEDLNGVEFCSHTTKIDRARAESQIVLLARLHGQFSAGPRSALVRDRFVSFQEKFDKFAQMQMEECCRNGIVAAEHVIPEALYTRRHEVWPATVAAVRVAHELPHTLNHGDVHLANWYIIDAERVGLTDWSAACANHWSRDVAYVLGTSLAVDDRRAWEEELLHLYLAEFSAAGGPRVKFPLAFDQYRRQVPSALAYWTVTLAPGPQMPVFQPADLTLEFVRRLATAMDDLGSLDLLATGSSRG